MRKKKINEIIEEAASTFLAESGYELYNVEFVKEGKDWFLRVYIDRTAGEEEAPIGTEDCEIVSRWLSTRLDEIDPIEQHYYLEVSSPGIERVLLKEKHYEKAVGKPVEIKLFEAIGGTKKITGVLERFAGEYIQIAQEQGEPLTIPLEQIARARQIYSQV